MYPSPGNFRSPSPRMDFNPGSQYNPVCPTTCVVYPVAGSSSMCAPLPPLNPHLTAPSPPIGQPAVGRLSPQLTYQLPHNSPIYVPDANIVESHQPKTFIDMENINALPSLSIAPMEDITINSRDFPELEDRNLSESLSMNLSLNSDAQANRLQENMTDSFTRLANNAFNEFVG